MRKYTSPCVHGPLDGEKNVSDHKPKDGECEWLENQGSQVHLYEYSKKLDRWTFVRSAKRSDIEQENKP